MSLNNQNLPIYHKNINSNVYISYGEDSTGDINNHKNIEFIGTILKKHTNNQKNKFYLITSDGGFDEGSEFNNKEQLHYFLILNEILVAITLQEFNGCFIIKFFDIFTETSVHLLYLLSLIYKEIIVYKPQTSRPTNSEKYIVCKNFKLKDSSQRTFLMNFISTINLNLKDHFKIHKNNKLFKEIPITFENKIKEMNQQIIQKQCYYLKIAIDLCNQDFLNIYKNNKEKIFCRKNKYFIEWCKKYELTF